MDIYVYSDESGVFDRHHNDYFVFGGLVAFSYSEADEATRRYQHAEKLIKTKEGLANDDEAKACFLSNGGKSKLFRSLNKFHKFGLFRFSKTSTMVCCPMFVMIPLYFRFRNNSSTPMMVGISGL